MSNISSVSPFRRQYPSPLDSDGAWDSIADLESAIDLAKSFELFVPNRFHHGMLTMVAVDGSYSPYKLDENLAPQPLLTAGIVEYSFGHTNVGSLSVDIGGDIIGITVRINQPWPALDTLTVAADGGQLITQDEILVDTAGVEFSFFDKVKDVETLTINHTSSSPTSGEITLIINVL